MGILLRLSGFAWRYKLLMLAAYVSIAAATVLQVAVPRLLGTAIDEALEPLKTGVTEGISARLWMLGFLIIGLTALRGVFSYWQTYLGEAVSQYVSYNLRNVFYDKLQHMSFAYHDKEHTGNLMSKATADVEAVRFFIFMGLIRSIQIIGIIAVVCVLLVAMDWQLGLLSIFFVPVIATWAVTAGRIQRLTWRKVQAETGEMTTVLQENLIGTRVVKSFGAEKYEERKFGKKLESLFGLTYEANRFQAINTSSMQFLFWGATAVILWVGGRAVIDGRLTPGELAQFILYMNLLVQPVRLIGQLVNNFSRAISAGERIFETLDAKSPVVEKPEAKEMVNVKGHVRFENVTFAYDNQPAIKHFNLDVPPGQVVAFLGAPGSGKSTVVNLLARFYDANEGRITIDGVDVRDVTLHSLHRTVGVVQQDVFLFSASIRDNIAYGKPNATMEEVTAAAKTAQLHEQIMEMPQGYETMTGERGLSLSGGQRQRLAIARTLLIDPPILVLDDSTSSVDASTEAAIQDAMGDVVKGRTTFIIAHRLTSIQHADVVVILEHGEIAEIGTPQELLGRAESLFQQLNQMQRNPEAAPVNGNGRHNGRPLTPASRESRAKARREMS